MHTGGRKTSYDLLGFTDLCLLKQSDHQRRCKVFLLLSTCKCADKISPPVSLHLDSELLSSAWGQRQQLLRNSFFFFFPLPKGEEGVIFRSTLMKHYFPNQELQTHSSPCYWCCSEERIQFCHWRLVRCSRSKGSEVFTFLTVAAHKGKAVSIVGGGETWVRQTYCGF